MTLPVYILAREMN